MIAISKFKFYSPERATLRQTKWSNYTSYVCIYSFWQSSQKASTLSSTASLKSKQAAQCC